MVGAFRARVSGGAAIKGCSAGRGAVCVVLIGFAGFDVAGFFAGAFDATLPTVFRAFLAGLPPRGGDFLATAARFVPVRAFALAVDFALVFALVFGLVLALALGFDFRPADAAFFRPVLRAFLARAGDAFTLERALDRDAALDLLDLFLAMVVAAGKGFRRASQSEVVI
jgi:hypothetical protein